MVNYAFPGLFTVFALSLPIEVCTVLNVQRIDLFPNWHRPRPLRMLAHMPKSAQPPAEIAATIRLVRGQRVLLDSDLAELYGVSTRRLNEQVLRNLQRFPADFLPELTNQELAILKSHYATSSWGGRRKRPRAFTEHGAIMVATILDSPRAVLDADTRRQFDKVYEAILGLMATSRAVGGKPGELGTAARGGGEAVSVEWVGAGASSQNLNRLPSFSGFPIGPSADRVRTCLARFRFLPQYSS